MFESFISAGSTPETSFLNLITALAVMPMAAFTTLAVLGGGAGEPPSWMRPSEGHQSDDTQEQLDLLSSGLDQLAADVAQSQLSQQTPAHTPAFVQQVVVPVATSSESAPPLNQDTSSLVDDLDFDRLASNVQNAGSATVTSAPGFDEPVIRGFKLDNDEKA